jgi:hypothetical protein
VPQDVGERSVAVRVVEKKQQMEQQMEQVQRVQVQEVRDDQVWEQHDEQQVERLTKIVEKKDK